MISQRTGCGCNAGHRPRAIPANAGDRKGRSDKPRPPALSTAHPVRRSWLRDHESKDDERTDAREHARRWAMMRSEIPAHLRMRQETRARIAERVRELMPLGGWKERTA